MVAIGTQKSHLFCKSKPLHLKIKNKTYIASVNTNMLQENPAVSKQNETIKWKQRRKEEDWHMGLWNPVKFVGSKNLPEEDNTTL